MNLFKAKGQTDKVILDATKGIDDDMTTRFICTYAYASGSVSKQSDGSYRAYYNAGGGASGGWYKLTLPTGFKGIEMRCRDSRQGGSIKIYANSSSGTVLFASTGDGPKTNVVPDINYSDETGVTAIYINLGGWYREGVDAGQISYVTFNYIKCLR